MEKHRVDSYKRERTDLEARFIRQTEWQQEADKKRGQRTEIDEALDRLSAHYGWK